MDNLRWILLGIGLAIILGIYLVSRLKNVRLRMPGPAPRRQRRAHGGTSQVGETGIEPDAGTPADDFGSLFLDEDEPALEETTVSAAVQEPREPVNTDEVFSLFVIAPPGVPFRGSLLPGAMEAARMQYGDMQIYHRIEALDGVQKTLFSAANIREPGTFDPAAMEDFSTDGIAFFMQVHSGVDAVWAFEAMVESARILGESLGGTVCDATRSVLTKQTISHMREAVVRCQLQQRMAKAAS